MTSDSTVTPELFARLVPLNALRVENRADLAKKAQIQTATAGTTLFKIGEPAKQGLWLLEGSIRLVDADQNELGKISSTDVQAVHRIAHQSPRKVTAQCTSEVKYLAVDAGLLDVMLTWDQTGSFEVTELTSEDDGGTSDDWMARLLTMPTFQMVPPANLQAMFMRMEKQHVTPGQVIVKQGDDGDFFYVINEGKAMVTREQPNQKAIRLAELTAGACFGEEALISEAKRNATITMLTHGSLMRLSKDDFRSLLNEPLARKIDYQTAASMVESGKAKWLDVRLPSEFKNNHLPAAINLPLYMLRPRLATIINDVTYICCCDTGRRSSVAVFVLTQKGYDAMLLDGGIPTPEADPG